MNRNFLPIFLLILAVAGCARTSSRSKVVLSERYDVCASIEAKVEETNGGVQDTDITKIVVGNIPMTVVISPFPTNRVFTLATRDNFLGHHLSADNKLFFDIYDGNVVQRTIGMRSSQGRHGLLYVMIETDVRNGRYFDSISLLSKTISFCSKRGRMG